MVTGSTGSDVLLFTKGMMVSLSFVSPLLLCVSLVFSTSPCSVWLPHALSLSAGNSILHSAADSVTSAVQKASQALNERGERLGRAEERTADMMNSAEQFAVTAHKVRQNTGWVQHSALKF